MELENLTEMAATGRKVSLYEALTSKPAYVTSMNKLGNHLIHTAVLNGQTEIVKLIVQSLFGALEVDALNNQKKTPLHLAIAMGNAEMVSLLLDLNASTDITDDSEMMPIHLAAEQENVRVLQTLLERGVNPNVRGEGGFSALHFAAAADNARAISLLLRYGGNLTIRSNTGAYPVHVACKSGSSKALEAIIREGPWQNYSVESILSMKDRERQLPIHSAVTGGKVETLIICLKYGALVTSQQDDGSTPVHYAATQGNVDMLKVMHLMDKKRMSMAVTMRDIQGKTPLHWATFFNHLDVVKYLISLGADVNTSDFNQQTPLLSAASNGSWAALHILLASGADGSATDNSRHNFLHLAIRRGVDLQVLFDGLKCFDNMKERTNEKDCHGNTPLHLAAKEGYIPAIERMLKLGASPTIKDKNRQSAFHLAASQGRINTCRMLLGCPNGSIMKNEADGAGMTALHLAAQNGHLKILTILIQRGALIVRDNKDNTPLHLAAENGHTACVHLLLAMHSVLMDCLNVDGNTALHLAASNGHAAVVRMLLTAGSGLIYNASGRGFFDDVISKGHLSVAEAVVNHERWERCLQVYSKVYGMPILGLIQHLPSVYMLVLDRCVIKSDIDTSAPDYCISYNFRYLHLDDDFKNFANEHKMGYTSLMPLEYMMNFNRLGCLAHPLTLMFLRMKWNKYGLILSIVDLTFYIMYLASLTWFIVANRSLNHYDPVVLGERPSWDLSNFDDFVLPSNFTRIPPPKSIYQKGSWDINSPWFPPEARGYKYTTLDQVLLVIVITFCGFQIIKECYQFYRTKLHYLKVLKNYLEWTTFSTSLFFSIPFLMGYSTHAQWDAGALAIFLAWFNCLVNLQRFELVGIYIVMFLAIMKTLVQVFLIFMILVTAFGLAFYVLMQEDPLKAHSTPFLSIYRTFILIFEIEYLLTLNTVYLDNDPSTLHYSTLTFMFLAIFLFCMPLLLVNLLIGLAVGDIASVQSDAKQQKLATQVSFHASVEEMIPFLAKMQNDFKVYPNRYGYSCGEVLTKMAGITFKREVAPKVEETLVGKEIVKVKTRLKDLFTVCEKNREILQEMMKHMGFMTEDEVKDREVELRLSEGSMEDLTLRATQLSMQKSSIKMARSNIWKC